MMALEFWLVVSAFIFVGLGICLGYVIWGMDGSVQDRDIPTGDDW